MVQPPKGHMRRYIDLLVLGFLEKADGAIYTEHLHSNGFCSISRLGNLIKLKAFVSQHLTLLLTTFWDFVLATLALNCVSRDQFLTKRIRD